MNLTVNILPIHTHLLTIHHVFVGFIMIHLDSDLILESRVFG